MAIALGKFTTTAGTPLQVHPTSLVAHAVFIQAASSNTGKVYVMDRNGDKSTGVGVVAVIPVPTTNSIPAYVETMTGSQNALDMLNYWFDVENSGEGVQVSYLQM